ncbi:MAG: Uma2 family endonuclease [Chloroflexota bacterium]
MAALPQRQTWTDAEYLAFEREQEMRHELRHGQVYAMTGASDEHNLITSSTHVSLYLQLRGGACRVYQSDMRVKIDAGYVYPDLVVACGERRFTDDHVDTLINPALIIEVLSPSTERYDRGEKFQSYRGIATLQSYVLISQHEPRIEHFQRREQMWALTEAIGLDAVMPLPAVNCTLKLAAVYEQITF